MFFLFSLLITAGCTAETVPKGTVALVNGQAISFRQLEVYHDMNVGILAVGSVPSVEALRAQYGTALSTLIVYTLVQQELQKRGLSVDQKDLAAVEKMLVSEYPEGTFETSLQEDSIDLQSWRELLRDRISLQHFALKVLRPEVAVTAAEVDVYYAAHAKSFYKPERVRLQSIVSQNPGTLEEICRSGKKQKTAHGETVGGAADVQPDILVDERVWELEKIPEQWQKDVRALRPNQSTGVRKINESYQCLMLIETLPAQTLSVVDAYPTIEHILLVEKIDAAFWVWLEHALAASSIQASRVLFPDQSQELADGNKSR